MQKIGDPPLVKELIKNFSAPLFAMKFILLCIAFSAGVLALMNPRIPGEGDSIARKGIDVAIAMDVSKSMLATDIQPNRLQKAQEFTNKLMDALPEDRIALVLFAGRAFLQMPLTTDHNAAKMFVTTADPISMTSQGTVFSEAMRVSALAFNNKERRFKTVVLISDGEDHDLASLEAADEMVAQGIMINTIGIGSPIGSTIADPTTGEPKKDATGEIVLSKLNEEHLKQIARVTNGTYIHLQDTDKDVQQLLIHLSQIEKKAFTDVSMINFKSYYWWAAAIMLLLLLVEFFIPERKFAVK